MLSERLCLIQESQSLLCLPGITERLRLNTVLLYSDIRRELARNARLK